jgi:hypothetical protein
MPDFLGYILDMNNDLPTTIDPRLLDLNYRNNNQPSNPGGEGGDIVAAVVGADLNTNNHNNDTALEQQNTDTAPEQQNTDNTNQLKFTINNKNKYQMEGDYKKVADYSYLEKKATIFSYNKCLDPKKSYQPYASNFADALEHSRKINKTSTISRYFSAKDVEFLRVVKEGQKVYNTVELRRILRKLR